jgi:hypothetical protein
VGNCPSSHGTVLLALHPPAVPESGSTRKHEIKQVEPEL